MNLDTDKNLISTIIIYGVDHPNNHESVPLFYAEDGTNLESAGYKEENPGSGKWCKTERSVKVVIIGF